MAANCKLRLVQFCETGGDKRRVGVERENGGSVVDITAVDPSIPADMKTFLQGWDSNAPAAERLVAASRAGCRKPCYGWSMCISHCFDHPWVMQNLPLCIS